MTEVRGLGRLGGLYGGAPRMYLLVAGMDIPCHGRTDRTDSPSVLVTH